tara:strand:+ start:209 stop:2815 length:2607 start_codon:yes stop_codon:yes gene_type:complete
MSTIKVNELATSAISLTDFFVKANSAGLANKNTMQEMSNFLGTIGSLGLRGVLLANADLVTLDGIYVAGDSGTYTNNGNLIIDVSNQIVLITITGNQAVFAKAEIPISLTIDATVIDGSANAVSGNAVYDEYKHSSLMTVSNPSDGSYVNYQTATSIFTIPNDTVLTTNNADNVVVVSGEKTVDISAIASPVKIVYDTVTLAFRGLIAATSLGADEKLFAIVRKLNPSITISCDYTIDGVVSNGGSGGDDEISVALFGKTDTFSVNGSFNSGSFFDRSINYFIPNFKAEYDNTTITSVSFRSSDFKLELAVVDWDGNTANPITIVKSFPQIPLSTNTVYLNLDLLPYNIVLSKNQWLYVKSTVGGASNLVNASNVFDFDSANAFTGLNNQVLFDLAYKIDQTYQANIVKNNDSKILTNVLEQNVLSTTTTGSTTLDVDQTSEGTRFYKLIAPGTSQQFSNKLGTNTFNLKQGNRYVLCFKQRYNQEDAIEYNGHGFIISAPTYSASTTQAISTLLRIPLDSSKIWYNLVQVFDFAPVDGEYNLNYRTYTYPSWTTTRLANDVTIKDVFILDLGVSGGYFYDKSYEFFKSVLSNKTFFDKLIVQDSSLKSENNSLYNGGLLKSLGDSMPETRTYQYIVANKQGMHYDGDSSTSVYINGVPTAHLSFVIGGTWCAPVTTPSGGSQTIAKSAYIRSRFLKYYNPKVLLIECGTNDSYAFESIYSGLNPGGGAYDYGLNDDAYEGSGYDASNGVYQDASGYNLLPSLGASYRGMLKQLVIDMPDTKIVVIGIPKTNLNTIGLPTFSQNYYDGAIGKNLLLKKVAEEFGFEFVDLYNGVGNNRYTFNHHVIDAIHFSTFGGKKAADAILTQAF